MKEGRSRLLFSRLLHLEHSGFFFFFFINLIISPGFDFPVPHYTAVNLHIDWIWEYNLKLSSYFAPNIILLIFEWTGAIFKRAVEEKKKTTQKNQTTKLDLPTLLRLFSQNRSGIRDYDFCKKKNQKIKPVTFRLLTGSSHTHTHAAHGAFCSALAACWRLDHNRFLLQCHVSDFYVWSANSDGQQPIPHSEPLWALCSVRASHSPCWEL